MRNWARFVGALTDLTDGEKVKILKDDKNQK
jgi:hypothetical protein